MMGTRKGYTSPQNKGYGVVQQSMHGLATIVAAAAVLVMSGWIHQYTAPAMYHFLLHSYGNSDLALMGMFIWDALACAAIFFLSRAIIVLALLLISTRLVAFFI